jgi:hypothetical protein
MVQPGWVSTIGAWSYSAFAMTGVFVAILLWLDYREKLSES